jgi:hypothetical protein
MGKQVETIENMEITNSVLLGSSLKSGIYMVVVNGMNKPEFHKIIKK